MDEKKGSASDEEALALAEYEVRTALTRGVEATLLATLEQVKLGTVGVQVLFSRQDK